MTLQQLITALINQTIVTDGDSVAELTRLSYFNQYSSYINTSQYIPIFYFNVLNNSIYINDTPNLKFVQSDLYTANDWVILNQAIYPFTATLTAGNQVITDSTITLAVGEYINGYGLPNNTTVLIIHTTPGSYTLSNNATVNATLADLFMTKSYSVITSQ